jgi:hypothetical protein
MMFYNNFEDTDQYFDITSDQAYDLAEAGEWVYINYWDDEVDLDIPFMIISCNDTQSLLEYIEDAEEAQKEGCRIVYQYSIPQFTH